MLVKIQEGESVETWKIQEREREQQKERKSKKEGRGRERKRMLIEKDG